MIRTRSERAGASEPRERRGDRGVPAVRPNLTASRARSRDASERVGGFAGAEPPGLKMSPAMVAAAAIAGEVVDVRQLQ